MIIHGVDTAQFRDQFQHSSGTTLIIDGDGPAYRAAATSKRLDTALRRFQQDVLTQMFLTKTQDCRVHLTARDSHKAGRFDVVAAKPYQGQRNGKAKPPLLEPLRDAIALHENWLPEYEVILHRVLEADDGMMHDSYRLKEKGVVWSDDKDLRMTPWAWWDAEKACVTDPQPEGFVSLKLTASGNPKLIGRGPMFFWGQMLAGDQADNIKGIQNWYGKLCGPALTYDVLKECTTQVEAAELVLRGYKHIGQNALPEGWLLWLHRWHGDNVLQYLTELNLSTEIKEWLHALDKEHWIGDDTRCLYSTVRL